MTHLCKTRFCPSPTGYIHLGNARTALFSWLLQHHSQGHFLLRIEDTDQERSQVIYSNALQVDLNWMGLHWDEGPGCDQGRGPYFQSERQPIYDQYYATLETQGLAYTCFCKEDELALQRKLQLSQGKPPRYSGTCRNLSKEEIQTRLAQGEKAVLRFVVADDGIIEYTDFVRGKQRFLTADIGDFIIRRSDGTSPFMYCNAIDDALMQVTHVVRGEDHIANTPRQRLILAALNLPIPEYGHISLIMGPDGTPLSKRNGSHSIQDLRVAGYLPIAINNYLARLGHYYGHDQFLSLAELAAEFKLESLSKSPAKFNADQLEYWQKEALLRLSSADFWQWLPEMVQEEVPSHDQEAFLDLIRSNVHLPKDAEYWLAVVYHQLPAFTKEQQALLKQATPAYFDTAIHVIERIGLDYAVIIDDIKQKLALKGRALFMPLRIALSGVEHGPELAKLLKLLPLPVVLQRLEEAKNQC